MLQPVAHYLDHHALWQFNRRSVAGGLAVGLFFSVALPTAQIPFAAIFAMLFRVNIPVAALATLLSNPFTTPLILYAAYHVGTTLTGQSTAAAAGAAYDKFMAAHAMTINGLMSWVSDAIGWLEAAGWPLLIGLGVISLVLTVCGYFGTNLVWRIRTQWRWHCRMQRRHSCSKHSPL